MLFGTDTPMDMGQRGFFTRTTIASLEKLDVAPAIREELYAGCASHAVTSTRYDACSADVYVSDVEDFGRCDLLKDTHLPVRPRLVRPQECTSYAGGTLCRRRGKGR